MYFAKFWFSITLEYRIIGGFGIMAGRLEISPKSNNRGSWNDWGGKK